jgi:hypothetical protein
MVAELLAQDAAFLLEVLHDLALARWRHLAGEQQQQEL